MCGMRLDTLHIHTFFQPYSYRGISVTNSVSRVYGKILKNQIEQEMKDVEEQNGFRVGRSCVDSIFILKQVAEKRICLLYTSRCV